MNVLLSIRPVYAEAIMNESKRYEFRKSMFRSDSVKHAFVYSTSPVQKIVGAFRVGKVVCDDPRNLWRQLRESAGIEERDFFLYFRGRNEGFAIEIRSPQEFGDPVDPWELDPNFVPPQSFRYVDWTLRESWAV
jgi:type I restriction enzyme S subunit